MSYYRKAIGKVGEDLACEYLKNGGHKILCRNFSCKCGEIDIISEQYGYVVFTEVKTRRNNNFSTPAEAVTAEKQKHILRTAQFYFKLNCVENYDCRFDVIEILFDSDINPHIGFDFDEYGEDEDCFVLRHIENAFGEGGI